MRARIGTHLTWDGHEFVVIAIDYRHAVLRSLEEEFVREVVIEELLRAPTSSGTMCDRSRANRPTFS